MKNYALEGGVARWLERNLLGGQLKGKIIMTKRGVSMSSQEHKQKIWNLIKEIKVGMLCTQVGTALHSRPMHLVQNSYDGHIWFFTSFNSEKVFELNRDNQVNLNFADIKSETFVSLSGKARLSKDRQKIDELWNSFVGVWFPEGKSSSDVALIDLHVYAGEHWDSASSKLIQIYEIAKASVTHTMPDMGENEKFGSL